MQEIVRVQINSESVNTPMQQSESVAGQSQLPLSGFNFKNLHGCTININTTPSHSTANIKHQSVMQHTEEEQNLEVATSEIQ